MKKPETVTATSDKTEVAKQTSAKDKPEKLPDIVYKWLPVKLSDAELKIKQNELIETMDKKDSIEGDFDEVKKDFKTKLKSKDNVISGLRGVLRTGIEYRDVECVEEHDYTKLVVNIIRSDTKEVVNKRAMTQEERQRHLFKVKKEEDEKAKAKTATAQG